MPKIQYKEINFRGKSLELINLVNQVVEEYQAQGYELTLRQAYYQLVARGYIPNNERSYKNIGSLINDGRLAGLIDWYSITDRTRNLRSNGHWDNPADVIGSAIASFFGGWDAGLATLLIFMGLDYISGLIVAGVFKNSPKTDTGSLESKAGWKGLCRKCMTLIFVLVAYRLDLVIGTNYIRDAVIIAFIANETISLVENAGLMGLPLPAVITKAIDILQKKTESEGK